MKVYNAIWFTQLRGPIIGLVTCNNGYEDKAYIGTAEGENEEQDINHILATGAPMDFAIAIQLTGGKR